MADMDMDMTLGHDDDLHDRVTSLSDLELAFLLCLINKEHCIVSTQPPSLDDLVEELKLISTKTFGLAPLTISCTPTTTLDDLAAGIVHPVVPPLQLQHLQHQHNNHRHHDHYATAQAASPSTRSPSPLRSRIHTASRTTSPGQPQEPSSYFPTIGSPGSGVLTPIPIGASAFSPALGGGGGGSIAQHQQQQHPPGTAGTIMSTALHGGQIANVILARNLDHAPRAVQVQVLELLRTRRIFTRTSVQTAPKRFLFIAVLSSAPVPAELNHNHSQSHSQSRSRSRSAAAAAAAPVPPSPATSQKTSSMTGLMPHLNDYFFIAHRHDAQLDGFANLDDEWTRSATAAAGDDEDDYRDGDSIRTMSVLRKSGVLGDGSDDALFSEDDVAHLASLSDEVSIDVEVVRYQMNITAFLRMNRAVAGGISPVATKHLERLIKSLAPLNKVDYVTPALVALAVRKVYLHRIRIAAAERERSMQWGSDVDAVRELLEGIGPEEVLEQVLSQVAVPV
jgi:hypothetical protein